MTDRPLDPQKRVTNRTRVAKKKRDASKDWTYSRHRIDGTFKKSKRHKYNARGRWIGDHFFDSAAEADRYLQLFEMQQTGVLSDLEVHPRFPCHVQGTLICTYEADFRYRIRPGKLGSRLLIEDVKGPVTDLYRIKRALVHALHPIEIMELPVPRRGGVERYRWLTADQIGKPGKEEAWLTGSSIGLLRSRGGSPSSNDS